MVVPGDGPDRLAGVAVFAVIARLQAAEEGGRAVAGDEFAGGEGRRHWIVRLGGVKSWGETCVALVA